MKGCASVAKLTLELAIMNLRAILTTSADVVGVDMVASLEHRAGALEEHILKAATPPSTRNSWRTARTLRIILPGHDPRRLVYDQLSNNRHTSIALM
jgi:hypothetical protein